MIGKKIIIGDVVGIFIALAIAAVFCIWSLNTLQADWALWGW